jgi:hypothetical protein
LRLQGVLAGLGRQLDGLPARRNGAVEVSREPEDSGHLGQHLSQSNPIIKRSSQGLGLDQQGEVPSILSQSEQRASQREAELDSQYPRIAVFGQVRQGLESLLEGSHGLTERGTVVGPGTGLLAAGHRFVPHLAPQSMVCQAFDLVWVSPRSHLGDSIPGESLNGLDQTRVQRPPSLLEQRP